MKQLLLLFAALISSVHLVNSQCTNSSPWITTTASSVAGTTVSISSCTYQTEYNTINGIVTGNTYTIAYNLGGCVTVHSGSNAGPVIAFGNAPLTFTSTYTGTIYVSYNTNCTTCGTATSCGTSTIQTVSVSGGGGGGTTGCINTSAFGSISAPTTNTTATISTCNFQTEYSTISNIVAGNTYQVGSSCGGYITVRSGAYNGPVVAAGNAPLTFTATSSGTYYIHYNTNSNCGTATNCCTTTITCTSCSTTGGGCIGGQNNNCATADPFCSSQTYTYCNTTNVADAGQYNCLYSTPNPMWMYLNIAQSGPISITMNQYTTAGTGIDVDFALWGPFTSLSAACAGITPSTVIPTTYPSGNLVDCSYSSASTEVADIPNAVAGQFYMLLITNFSGSAGYIQFNQTGGTGLTNCNIVSPTPCSISSVTATPTGCNGSNQYSVSGTVTFTNPPTTGTLTITSSCGGSQTFNAPFTSPLNYNITGVSANTTGGSCTITASFSATTCTGTSTFTAPRIPVVSGANQTICSGGTLNIPLTSTVTGSTFSWSAANNGQVTGESTTTQTTGTINNQLTTTSTAAQTVTYTASATANGCASAPVQVIATVNPLTTPAFTQVGPICSGGTFTLPTTSTNGITGTWSPTVNNTTTTTYTFTPSAGQCASTTTMTVTVNQPTVPTFTQITPICNGGTISLLTTSSNGFTGTWSPAVNTSATTTYIFTPTAGQCASQTNMTVTVNQPIVPAFTQVSAICSGGTFTLPTTSTNGISGTWSPAVNNTATTTYTFTPNTGSCATTATMTVTVNQPITPTFNQIAAICSGGSFSLPTTSTNGISGTWSPAVNNTTTTTYTFTPTAGQCATNATMTVTVNQQTTPTFAQVGPVCSGNTFTLPATSTNSISGIWTPSVNSTATTTYTFIPNAGQCAATTTMTVTVGPPVTPTFTPIPQICSGGTFTLPTTSNNSITGTWSPAINNTATTTYTFTPAAGQCATTTTLTVNVSTPVTPTFNPIAAICAGGSFSLPTISTNGISGTWSPAVNNTTTTTYTFTPNAGQCATTTTRTVIVNTPTVPTFNQVAAICSGGTFTLPTTSTNSISGTWSPAVNNTATTTYTFTPAAGACATTTTMSVTVNPNVTPTFTQVAPICSGGSFTLPTTSDNSITGTWSPAINNTATTTYTFTPTAGVCATTATMSVTVNQPTVPTFTQVAAICSGGTFTLPTTSNNAITGTWSPAVNNTATTTYTFTPTAGQCATTATMTVTVNQPTVPTFTQIAPICSGGTITLPTTSTNSIAGTWSPAVNNTATTTYTFTPAAGACATTTTMSITVNQPVTPTFTQIAPICSGGSFTLPTTSTNSIAGTWSPAVNNTATTTYIFTPAVGACATTTTMSVTVNPNVTPTFTQVAPICSGGSFTLPTTSVNSITGTWSPAVNNTATTTYTFTPTAGQCATTATMSVTVNQPTVPTFTQVAAICSGGTFTLPTTSNNAITGTWSPAVNNTATTTYTFTPTAGQCATTATMTVTVNQPTVPTFTQIAPICSGGTITLPTTSNNAISGTWSPAVNNTATTTYTFTPAAGSCATTTTMSITVNQPVTPTFTQIAPICSGGTITLPTTSTNSISGTWSPAVNNTATTTYTFTPAAGVCATTTTMSVTVNPNITPTFTQVAPICSGGSFTLPTTSNNSITGTWSPAVNNTATTTYTFTPTAGQCATTATMSVTVNQPTVPTFTQVAAICSGGTFTLPTTSNNAITGTWSPAVNNTATTTYTFTPTAGQCATTATMTVTVNQPTVPTFTQIAPICSGGTITLPTTSNNAITGTWSPAVNNTATTTYTFTPAAGTCATTTTMSITVNQPVTPTFTQIAPICSGGSFTLPTTSTNSIAGTWSPAVNNTATTTYIFTPAVGACATTTTMSVTVNPNVTPTFTQVAPICSGGSFTLPTTSVNSITGTWSPAVNNTATTTYTFTPTAGQCATTATMSVTVNQPTVPTFTQVAAICSGGTFTLPTTSNNAITGTWSPAVNNTATTTYTFTPTAGQCATTATMTVTVNQPTVPTFTQIAPICSGGTITLPTTSNNAISGTWSPAVNNTATTTYTFTPAAGSCATTTTMSITVNQPVAPTFTQIAPICSGGTITLPTTSNNAITGTWSPAVNNTATTTYTFTPAAGACATTTTMSVTVNPNVTPTFTQVAPICSGGSFTLPTTSDNAISGTWSPAVNNTATTTYTFTPTAGVCATTATMSVTVNQPTVPTFTQVAAICSGGTFTLPTTSNNAITGTWSPAVNNTATTTYTFTPTAGQCATTATMTVTVDQPVTPIFPSAGTFCLNDVLPQVMLPTTSLNGINGTWNPGMLSTATAGTFTYTFTPNAGECALPYSTTVTVNDPVTPAFNQIAPLCSGANFTLPATSTNSIAGSWSPAVNNTATTTYTFTPAAGTCANTATMTVVIGAQLTPTFVPDVTTGCVPLTVNFTNTSANSVSCSWNFGNGTTLAGCGPVSATFNSPGCYDITLTITDANGCSGTLTANNLICVEDAPDVAFTPSTGVISQLNTTVNFNNNTTGAVSYDWDFGDGFGSTVFEPTHTYPDEPNGYTVTLVATSAAGCVDSASAVIQYYEELIYYIPNTFTPDDDMYNQTFKPVFTSGFDPYDYNLFIYNRWGELIFESHDPAFGWDGTYGTAADNRKVQDGTYTWKIEFKTLQSDERKRVTGHVNLIR